MGMVLRSSMVAAVLLALAACGGDEGGSSTGNVCVPDATNHACEQCLDVAIICIGEEICSKEHKKQRDCKAKKCTGGHYRTLQEKYECQLENCSKELQVLQDCMDSNCKPGSACVGSF